MKKFLDRFFVWYNEHYLFAITVTTFLFLLQLFHLYWLFTDVVLLRLTGRSFFILPPFWGILSTILDYTEIPALISTSLVYINQLRQAPAGKIQWQPIRYLIFVNSQWLHLFWITDQIVIEKFSTSGSIFHWASFVAWAAILIDYAELPVMYDTAKKTVNEISKNI